MTRLLCPICAERWAFGVIDGQASCMVCAPTLCGRPPANTVPPVVGPHRRSKRTIREQAAFTAKEARLMAEFAAFAPESVVRAMLTHHRIFMPGSIEIVARWTSLLLKARDGAITSGKGPDRAACGRGLRRLSEKGLMDRGPKAGTNFTYTLTPRGRELLADLDAHMAESAEEAA